jgi:hypothetical protein
MQGWVGGKKKREEPIGRVCDLLETQGRGEPAARFESDAGAAGVLEAAERLAVRYRARSFLVIYFSSSKWYHSVVTAVLLMSNSDLIAFPRT